MDLVGDWTLQERVKENLTERQCNAGDGPQMSIDVYTMHEQLSHGLSITDFRNRRAFPNAWPFVRRARTVPEDADAG